VLAFWSDELITGHHLGGSLVDPLTGALLILGLATALLGRRGYAERLALVWFIGGLVLVAVSHYEPGPSTSRLLIVIPAVALLCGLAVCRIVRAFEPTRRRLVAGVVVCFALGSVLPWLNLHQLLVVSPRKMIPSHVVMVMKALQEHAPHTVVEVGSRYDGEMDGVGSAYPWLKDRYRFLGEDELAEMMPGAGASRPVFFVDEESRHLLERLRARLPPDYRSVEDRDRSGQYRTHLFVPGATR